MDNSDEVLTQVRSAYFGCRCYHDRGISTLSFTTDDQSAFERLEGRQRFATYFVRPDRFLEMTSTFGSNGTGQTRRTLWSNGRVLFNSTSTAAREGPTIDIVIAGGAAPIPK